MKVSISILKEKENLKEVIEKVNKSKCDYLHIDVMDNTFTNSSSFDINSFNDISINKKIDVHIMSDNIDKLVDDFSRLNPEFITFHVEIGSTLEYINKIKNKGIKVGIAVNPNTDIEKVYPYLEMVDLILIMSVNPGKGGQKFMPEVICKMQELKEIQPDYKFLIEVDGGINNETIKYISNYVDISVCGSYITDSKDYDGKIQKLNI